MKKEQVVQILRKPDTTRRPQHLVEHGRQIIGASTVSPNSDAPLTGLSSKEVKLLLPYVLGVPFDNHEFQKTVNNFYYDSADIDVPPVVGVKFHIDLIDNSKELGAELSNGELNLPININEYVLWRKAKVDPSVAPSKDDLSNSPEYKFYVHDPDVEWRKELNLADLRDKAMDAFIRIKGKYEMYNPILRMYGLDPIHDYDNDGQKERDLRKIAAAEYLVGGSGEGIKDKMEAFELFIERVGDEDLQDKALIMELIDKKILRKVDEIIFFGAIRIGANLDQAVDWWLSAEASENVATIKGKLESLNSKKKSK